MGTHPPTCISIEPLNHTTQHIIMSWDGYVTTMEASADVEAAMICGFDGTLWAKGAKFSHNAAEIKKITEGFNNNALFSASGVTLEAVKYMFLRGDNEVVYARKGAQGLCVCKSNQAIIICKYNKDMNAGQCNTACEGIKDYLKSNNY